MTWVTGLDGFVFDQVVIAGVQVLIAGAELWGGHPSQLPLADN